MWLKLLNITYWSKSIKNKEQNQDFGQKVNTKRNDVIKNGLSSSKNMRISQTWMQFDLSFQRQIWVEYEVKLQLTLASLHRGQCIGQCWREASKGPLHLKKQQTALAQTVTVGKRADMTSSTVLINSLPLTPEALCFLWGSQVFLCFCVYVCALTRVGTLRVCVCLCIQLFVSNSS